MNHIALLQEASDSDLDVASSGDDEGMESSEDTEERHEPKLTKKKKELVSAASVFTLFLPKASARGYRHYDKLTSSETVNSAISADFNLGQRFGFQISVQTAPLPARVLNFWITKL